MILPLEMEFCHEQTFCRLCGNRSLTEVLDLGSHALSGRFPSSKEENVPSYPLVLVRCSGGNNCGLVQLKHDVNDRNELYGQFYGYMSGINSTMKSHLENLVQEARKRVQLDPQDVVLDIGSNDGTTLKFYPAFLERIGVDPTGKQFGHLYPENIKLHTGYFDSKFADSFGDLTSGKKAKIITSIAMFYDLPNPIEFAKNIKKILHREGVWITEQSYLPSMLATNSFDTVCHEHLEYYSFRQMDYIAREAGLHIIGLSFSDINGGSFRITFSHKPMYDLRVDTGEDATLISQTIVNEMNIGLHTETPYREFRERCSKLKKDFLDFLTREKTLGKTFCIYGASTKGNVLLQYYGIDSRMIDCIAERNPHKYGRFTPKTCIPIKSEEEVRKMNPDYMIVLPWHFKAEFLQREKEYMENGGILIFPLPYLDIQPKKKDV